MCSTSAPRSSGRSDDAEVRLEVRLLDARPDPRRQRRQLRRIEDLQPRVLVEHRLELGDLVVRVGAHHRRDEVVDDHRVRAALGLHALAGVVDDERVDERHVAQRGVGRALGAQREHLARQPLERPVLAEVDDRVRAPRRVDPAVAGEVVVGRRQLGVVVDADRILAVAARRLDRDDDVAELEARDDEVARRRGSGRRAAGPSAPRSRRASTRAASRTTSRYDATGSRSADDASWSSVRNSGSWPPDAISACMSSSPCAYGRSTGIPSACSASSSRSALAGVSRPTAIPTFACFVGKLVSSSATRRSRRRQVAQPRAAHREPRDPRAALEVGHVARDRDADR